MRWSAALASVARRCERPARVRALLVVLVLCTLLPVLGFSTFLLFHLADQERAAMERGLRVTVNALAATVDRHVMGSVSTLEALARSSHLMRTDLRAFHAELTRVVPTQPGWRSAFLIDAKGGSPISTNKAFGTPLPALTDRWYWREVMATGKPVVSDLVTSRVTGASRLFVAVPVVLQGQIRYVLCAALDTAALTGILLEQHLTADWTATILDREHIIIGRSRAADMFVGKPVPVLSPAIRSTTDGSGVIWIVTKDGIPSYGAFTRAAWSGWTVFLGLPATTVTSSRQQTLRLIGGVGLVFLGVSLAVALVLGGRIARAIRSLSARAARPADELRGTSRPSAVVEVNEVDQALASAIGERRRAEERAKALAVMSRTLAQSLDPKVVAERSVASIRALLVTRFSFLYRLDDSTGDLVLMAAEGPHEEWHRLLSRGNGTAGIAVIERGPVATADMLQDPRISWTEETRAAIGPTRARAVLAVPLIIGDVVLGALGARDDTGRVFSEEDIALAQAFADQTALALHNADVMQQATSHRADLEALIEASRQLVAMQPLDSLLQRIAESCGRLLRADSVGFRLVDGDELYMAAFWGDVPVGALIPRIKITESLTGRVAIGGEPLPIEDLTSDHGRLSLDHEEVIRLGYRSWLGVPVKMGERVIGVLHIRSRATRRFRAEEIALAVALASQAAAAIENVRLYEKTRETLETLSRTQEQLAQAQKMEAVGRLAGGVAHDFNNLLTVILGRSRLAIAQLPPDDPLRSPIELIEKTASRAAALTAQLLAFGRKQMLQSKVLDLNVVVADLMTLLERLVRENIHIVFRPGERLGRIEADPSQLEQVVLNLVVNARDAMPMGGTLTIETSQVDLDEASLVTRSGPPPGRYVLLAITDTGLGMDRETQLHVFEPFFTTKGVGEGTGLGLATVYGIVKQSGGDVVVRSEPGGGSTFSVFLPSVDVVIDAGAEPTPPQELARGTETVLLVEDSEDVRELAREILESGGYRVLEAFTPDDAIHIALEHPGAISLLLTDVVMPGRSGLSLARYLALGRPEMRVLYMSGYAESAADRGLLEHGASFIAKPFTPETLLAKVRSTLLAPSVEVPALST